MRTHLLFLDFQPLKLDFLFYFKRRKDNTSKQTKKNVCFIGSEAETHDVISDVFLSFLGMNVSLCYRVEEG